MITAGAKTLLIGDSKAGKTSIIKKYVFNNFGEKEVPTIGGLLLTINYDLL